jgi:cytochrome c553
LLQLALVFCYRSAAAQNQRGLDTIRSAISLQADLANGKRLYARNCVSCHGRKGHGEERSLVPALAGQVSPYTIKQLVDVGEGDRNIIAMHRTLTAQDLTKPQALADVAGYVATLPINHRTRTGSGEQLALGTQIYDATCAQCHGRDGGGNPAWFAPSLRGQHYSYLLTQLRQLAAGHRYAVDPVVARLVEALSLEQLTAVADVTSRLSHPATQQTSQQ